MVDDKSKIDAFSWFGVETQKDSNKLPTNTDETSVVNNRIQPLG